LFGSKAVVILPIIKAIAGVKAPAQNADINPQKSKNLYLDVAYLKKWKKPMLSILGSSILASNLVFASF